MEETKLNQENTAAEDVSSLLADLTDDTSSPALLEQTTGEGDGSGRIGGVGVGDDNDDEDDSNIDTKIMETFKLDAGDDDEDDDNDISLINDEKSTTIQDQSATGSDVVIGDEIDSGEKSPNKSKTSISPTKNGHKRTIDYVHNCCSDEEEEFAGFDECNGNEYKRKKIKEEPSSDNESLNTDTRSQEIKMEFNIKTEQQDSQQSSTSLTGGRRGSGTPKRQQNLPKSPPMSNKPTAVATPVAAAAAVGTKPVTPKTPSATPQNIAEIVAAAGAEKYAKGLFDPKYRKPFELGWKREVVFRNPINDLVRKHSADKGEVYYITPAGKKLRKKMEIIAHINPGDGLNVNDFSFAREALGMAPDDEEIVRMAKTHTPNQRKPVNFLDIGEPDPSFGFGKRIPKPKMPKGASPPPSPAISQQQSTTAAAAAQQNLLSTAMATVAQSTPTGKSSRASSTQSNKKQQQQQQHEILTPVVGSSTVGLNEPIENKTKSIKSSKTKGEPCTIQCVLAMGTIPQLQCKKCLCLYHHECVGLEKYEGPIANYICESCLQKLSNTTGGGGSSASSTSTIITTTATTTSPATATTTVTMTTPPNQASLSSDTNLISLSLISPIPSTPQLHQQPSPSTTISSVAASSSCTQQQNPINNSVPITAGSEKLSKNNRNSSGNGNCGGGGGTHKGDINATTGGIGNVNNNIGTATLSIGNVIGGMTTWVPPTANLTTNRSHLDMNISPPQSIAIVAGRKYIMVPKTNLMSVSPSGEVKIGDNNGMPLQYFENSSGFSTLNQQSSNNVINTNKSSAATSTSMGTAAAAAAATPLTPAGGGSSSLTTGDDVTPPLKKRLLSRSVSSKVQTPAGSPNNLLLTTAGTSEQSLNVGTGVKGLVSKATKFGVGQTSGGTTTSSSSTGATGAASTSVHTLFATNFFNNVSLGYNVLLHTFQYLKVQELLRASCVCRMWNQAANNSILWRTVRMKNSQVNDWSGLVNTLKRNGTKHLDLRKMLISTSNSGEPTTWQNFSNNIGRINNELETIDLCRLPSKVIENLMKTNSGIKILNAVSIKDDNLKLENLSNLTKLQELRLKSLNSMQIDSLKPLSELINLKHLSLTSIKELGNRNYHVIGNLIKLETLELGECSELNHEFGRKVLSKLQRLERLRLEKGQDQCCIFDILDTVSELPVLTQLELVNFDVKQEFDIHLHKCRNLRRLLIIPTYISQSATTNNVILNGVLKLADNLEQLTWVVTLELLRVTELYVDQCDSKRRKMHEDKIPVLKPVPGISAEDERRSQQQVPPVSVDVAQVEILPLYRVETILATHMPNTKCSIMKVPYHATWRQNMIDLQ